MDQFFDDMQNLFQKINPAMTEDYTVAEIRRAINGIPDYQKIFAAETYTVQKTRTVLTRLATIDQTEYTVVQNSFVDPTKMIFYEEITRDPVPAINLVRFVTEMSLNIKTLLEIAIFLDIGDIQLQMIVGMIVTTKHIGIKILIVAVEFFFLGTIGGVTIMVIVSNGAAKAMMEILVRIIVEIVAVTVMTTYVIIGKTEASHVNHLEIEINPNPEIIQLVYR